MPETKIIHCVNLPALILSAPVRLPLSNIAIGPIDLYAGKGFSFSYGDVTYLIVIFFFWWWAGKQIDERRIWIPVGGPRAALSSWMRSLYSVLAVLSLALACLSLASMTSLGFSLHLRASSDGLEYPIFGALWGVLLSAYFITRVWKRRPPIASSV